MIKIVKKKNEKIIIIKDLIHLVEINTIQSFHIIDQNKHIMIDKNNVKNYTIDFLKEKKIYISSKYDQYFIKNYNKRRLNYFVKYFKLVHEDFYIINNKKIFNFSISVHAKKQFVKRMLIFKLYYQDNLKEELFNFPLFESFIDDLINGYYENIYRSTELDEEIVKIMKQSKFLDITKVNRKRDKVQFKKREDKQSALRYIFHPLLFIFSNEENKNLITVELYSHGLKTFILNKESKEEIEFLQKYKKKFNI